MPENRRDVSRLSHAGVGWLAAKGFRAVCTVEDISVSGARCRVSSIKLSKPRSLPQKLTLTTVLGGEQVTLPGAVTRVERDSDGLCLGVHFLSGDAAGLRWLIDQAQREDGNARLAEAAFEHRRGA